MPRLGYGKGSNHQRTIYTSPDYKPKRARPVPVKDVVACPEVDTCGAQVSEPCRTASGEPMSGHHASRKRIAVRRRQQAEAVAEAPKPGHARCPACGAEVKLTSKGELRMHDQGSSGTKNFRQGITCKVTGE